MMNRRTVCLGLSTLLSGAGLALAASASGAPPALPVPMMQAGNHLSLEQLGFNMLTTNRRSLTALVSNPFNDASFSAGARLAGRAGTPVPAGTLHRALLDPSAREVMKDLVECALGGHQRVSWTPGAKEAWRPTAEESSAVARTGKLTWTGRGAGLCPAWATGAPDASCQELVSSCLLTRNNARGRPASISIRGTHAALATTKEERERYKELEGAFFGNILDPDGLNPAAEKTAVDQAPPRVGVIYNKAFVCSPPDPRFLMSIGCDNMKPQVWISTRVCAVPDLKDGARHEGCVATYAGSCREATPNAPAGTRVNVCAPASKASGDVYPSCTAGGRTWARPASVFLPPLPPTNADRHACRPQRKPDRLRDHNRPSPDPGPEDRARARKLGTPDDRVKAIREQRVTPAVNPALRQRPQAPAR
ncbi:hypothetical protein [Sorangium cellulosum]|nr:hypothetical protein [Sorangium cellulosum]